MRRSKGLLRFPPTVDIVALDQGGELVVSGSPPSGLSDSSDSFFLTGITTFTITPKARSIGA